MPSSSEMVVTMEEEDPQQKLDVVSRRKKFWTDLAAVGVLLSLIIVSLLCSFLIPGLPQYTKDSMWQFAAMASILTAIFVGVTLKEFLSSPQTNEEPKPLTGADLC